MHPLINFILVVNALLLSSSISTIEEGEVHALYLSVVEVKLTPNDKSHVIFKVFTNDLNDALKNASLGNNENRINAVNLGLYFNTKVKVYINGISSNLEYQKIDEKNDSLFIHFELNSTERFNTFKIEAPFLMELFPTQRNIVNVTLEQEKFYFNLDINNTIGEITF